MVNTSGVLKCCLRGRFLIGRHDDDRKQGGGFGFTVQLMANGECPVKTALHPEYGRCFRPNNDFLCR